MSFMTTVIFSWILFLIIFCIYNSHDASSCSTCHKNYDIFYMIQQEQREEEKQGNQSRDGPTVLAYSAVVAAMIIQQQPQIDV